MARVGMFFCSFRERKYLNERAYVRLIPELVKGSRGAGSGPLRFWVFSLRALLGGKWFGVDAMVGRMQMRSRRCDVAMVSRVPESVIWSRLRGFAMVVVAKVKLPAVVLAPLVLGMSLMYLGVDKYLKMENTAKRTLAPVNK